MKFQRGNAVLVQLYAPLKCSNHAMLELSKFAGGCTILDGVGEWLHNMEWAVEPVRKYEWVVTQPIESAVELAEDLCRAFLKDNPAEVEALCTVLSQGKTIYVRCTREGGFDEQ